jgi:DNA-binding protein HU-beta
MNKTELITNMAEKSNMSKKDTELALNALMESIEDVLARGEKVQLAGFGSFEVRQRAERTGRNPQTMAEITIPASKVPVFRSGRTFKDMVNK